MASIDDIFKSTGHAGKRKLDAVRDPTEIYKSAKLSSSSSSTSHPSRSRPPPPATATATATASDEDQEMADSSAGPLPPASPSSDYGPAAPPSEDEDEQGDDADGRFFGGGISASERAVLDYMDDLPSTTAPDSSTIDLAWLKRTSLAFEKRITRNAELRARFESDPPRFIDSEADLDAGIKALSTLSEHPALYADFARLGCVGSLVGLLAHENTDIAIDAVEIVGELTDEDVAATEEQWGALVDALLEADLLGLLVSNFGRLDEAHEADRAGVYHALGVVENLCSRGETAEAVGREEALLKWLLARAGRVEKPVGQNKQYAAEILAILVQASAGNRRRLAGLEAVDAMLQLVSAYRKRDPEKGGEEEEYMENLFEALTCLVDEPEGKDKFVEAEGVELCLMMLKEGKLSKPAALRLLDHAAGGASGAGVCQKIVDAGGLKTVFTMFMKKNDAQTTEHLVGIFASMLRLLPGDSAERIRTLAKFVEKDYEKTEKLVKLRRDYGARVGAVDAQIKEEQRDVGDDEREEAADEWFSRRLDAGLFCLQTIDVILAWLIAEDDGARKKIHALLADRDETVAVIKATVQEQIDGIDPKSDDAKDTREMLQTLAQFLQ